VSRAPGVSPAKLSQQDVLDQFERFMRSHGVVPIDRIQASNKLVRFRAEGHGPGKKDAWYRLHFDAVPSGMFGDFKTGVVEKWRADIGRELTAEEITAHKARVEAMSKERAAEEAKQRQATAAAAKDLWKKSARHPSADHPYLRAKGVSAYGLRESQGRLVVPVCKGGELVGLQFIHLDGTKRFMTGTPKAGAYHVLGHVDRSTDKLAIAEGYATAATVHALSGWPVFVAFDAGNLGLVARAARKVCPDAVIVLAADDDRNTPGNPGLTKAQAAAAAVQGIVCEPQFPADVEGSDWNDLAAAIGNEAAAEALRHAFVIAQGEPLDKLPARPAPPRKPTRAAEPSSATDAEAAGTPGNAGPLAPRYELRPDGLYWCDVEFDGKGRARALAPMFLCSPLKIEALTRDLQGRGWGRLVSFTDADKIHKTTVIPARLFGTSRSDELRGALLDAGLPIIASAAKAQRQLNDYLMREAPEDRARCVTRTGWHGGSFVLPSQTFGPVNGERFYLADEGSSAYERCNKFELWRDLVSSPSGSHRLALFSIACAFAGPLLDLAGAESGGFHIVGDSTGGKSTLLRLAASVWGSPTRYVRQWRLTSNAVESIAESCTDTLLPMDEMGQADPKEVGEIAYQIANSAGKARATKDGGAREVRRWRVLLLSNGEIGTGQVLNSVGQKLRAGQEVRFVEVPSDMKAGFGVFDSDGGKGSARALSIALADAASANYGHAGPLFVERLAAQREAIAKEVRECVAQFVADVAPRGASGQVLRVAARFGLVAYAGELATQWKLTGWEFEAVGAACRYAFASWLERRGTAGAKEPMAMVAQVRAYIEEHGGAGCQDLTEYKRAQGRGDAARYGTRDDFDPADYDPMAAANEVERKTVYRIGYRWREASGRTVYAIYQEAFKDKLCKGYEYTEVCKALIGAKVLLQETAAAGRFTKRSRIPAHKDPIPFFQLDGDALMSAEF
jgi:putative DNA primase/helicase